MLFDKYIHDGLVLRVSIRGVAVITLDTMLDGITIDVAHSCKSDHWSSINMDTDFVFDGVKLGDALRHLACAGSSARVKLHTVLRTFKKVEDAKRTGGGEVSIAALMAGTLKTDVEKLADMMTPEQRKRQYEILKAEFEAK